MAPWWLRWLEEVVWLGAKNDDEDTEALGYDFVVIILFIVTITMREKQSIVSMYLDVNLSRFTYPKLWESHVYAPASRS